MVIRYDQWSLVTLGRVDCAHLFPTSHSMMSPWYLQIGHGERVYTTEISKCHKSELFPLGSQLLTLTCTSMGTMYYSINLAILKWFLNFSKHKILKFYLYLIFQNYGFCTKHLMCVLLVMKRSKASQKDLNKGQVFIWLLRKPSSFELRKNFGLITQFQQQMSSNHIWQGSPTPGP